MEPLEAFSDAEWDCFGRMFANEEHDNSPEFHGQSSLLLGEDDGLNIGIQSTFCSTHEGHTNCYFSYPDHVLTNNAYTPMRFCMMDETNSGSFVPLLSDIVMGETVSLNEDGRSDSSENSDHGQMEHIVFPAKQLRLKRKLDVPELEVQGCVKNARLKNNMKLARNWNQVEETNEGSDGQSSSSFSSEDNTAYHENSGGATSVSESPAALNLNGKTRASRGSATDPQSLYARKRRERINERLRILQCLVPNGTKVDISTMLEEAVYYVKFLQLQIKLLSSDDLWMYAPIAYNGVDIGLNISRNIPPPL